MRFFESMNTAFGLDISDFSIKLIQLRKKIVFGKEIKLRLENFGTLSLPQGLIVNGKIVEQKKLVQILRNFLQRGLRHRLNTSVVVANLPDNETFITSFELPVNEVGLQAAIIHAIEKNIPVPLNELYYTVIPLGNTPFKQQKFMIAAVRQTISDSYALMLENTGLVPIALDVDSIALTRALTRFDSLSTEQFIIIDIGATRSSLIISDDQRVQLAITLPISGNALTNTIAEKIGVKMAEAELIKIRCGFDIKRCDLELRLVLQQQINNFIEKIHEALKFYETRTGKKISRTSTVFLAGGGAQLAKIDAVLSEKLKMKVRLGNPLINLTPGTQNPLPSPLNYATAIGLALPSAISFPYNNV